MKPSKEILCTLGPASLNEATVKRLEELGVSLFRINLSHTPLNKVASTIDLIRRWSQVPICLDSEGAQIRTTTLAAGHIIVKENELLTVSGRPVPGDAKKIHFHPIHIIHELRVGDFISIDFNSVLAQVVTTAKSEIVLRILNGGRIGENKAVTVDRDVPLPVLTEKDKAAVRLGMKKGIRHVALSFANHPEDVDAMRKLCKKGTKIISKIECRNGLLNLDGIARKSDALLIDRGDLSRQEPIERIPLLQKEIIRRAKKLHKKIYVATNLLESMVKEVQPTRAEVNDVMNTLLDGADGLVLAAETAIGQNPIGCAGMIVRLMKEYDKGLIQADMMVSSNIGPLLVEPHGGRLVTAFEKDVPSLSRLKKIKLRAMDLLDCQQFATGTYSPLTGFMDKETLCSVLMKNRLPNGLAWTMPIVLQVRAREAVTVSKGDRIALTDAQVTIYAVMDVSDAFRYDLRDMARRWFGTDSTEHPRVVELLAGDDRFLGGAVRLVRRVETPVSSFELSPSQSRYIFSHKGWHKIVGFHTRNVAHRAHEFIQNEALRKTHADGLYISPVLGASVKGDFHPEIVMKSYQAMIASGVYPAGKVVLGCFLTYPRFCGPREAVFTMLCRKNMGCSHFIIGRKHASSGDWHQESDYRKIFDSLGDLGIQPVLFEDIGYDAKRRSYGPVGGSTREMISGTDARKALKARKPLPSWFMRPEVQDLLIKRQTSGMPLFFE